MVETRQKTLYYKRAQIIGEAPKPLDGLIIQAHIKEKRPVRRSQRSGPDNDTVRLVNQCYARDAMIVGCMLEYTEGTFPTVVTLGEEELELAIAQLSPGEKEQFLEGLLFFGIQGDHVLLVQSAAVRAAQFESYLNWWLIEKTRVLQDGSYISLDDEPSRIAREKLGGVKSMTLRAPVSLDILRRDIRGARQNKTLTGILKTRIWEILQTEGVFAENENVADALATENVELSLEIRRVGRAKDGPSLLDELAHTLRNVDDDVFELETASGTIRGGDLRLSTTRSVKTQNGVPVLADVAEKMQAYLLLLIEERQIVEG